MARRKKSQRETQDGGIEALLAKVLVVSLWNGGANQNVIARSVGKSKSWVNEFLKGVPKPRR